VLAAYAIVSPDWVQRNP